MRTTNRLVTGLLVLAMTPLVALAQEPPGGPGEPSGPRPMRGEMDRGFGGPMDRLRGPQGEGGQLELMRGYLELVDRYTRLSRDPAAAGVAAAIQANQILKPKGADAAIAYFNKVLPQVKNEAVQRAIRLQLIELYKTAGEQDKAMEQLQQLMIAAPAGATASEPPMTPPPAR